MEALLALYREGRAEGGFDIGIEWVIERLLVSPAFLFRAPVDPVDMRAGAPYRIDDLELASRLSFFLWSSIPDDELLDPAERGELHEPAVLDRQVRRMLRDPRAASLVTNFAGQWLWQRNLLIHTPDRERFTDFDDNLREALETETRLFLESQIREDRPVPELLTADYTFMNERLARHYGVPDIYGSHFRRVPVTGRRLGGAAWPRQHPDRDLLRASHVAGGPGQVAAREHLRSAPASAAAQCAGVGGGRRWRGPHLGAGAPRGAPAQPGLRQLPRAHGSARLRGSRTSMRPAGGGTWAKAVSRSTRRA